MLNMLMLCYFKSLIMLLCMMWGWIGSRVSSLFIVCMLLDNSG